MSGVGDSAFVELLSEAFDIVTFRAGYNTAIVVLGALLLGAASGTIGCFAVLRKRALIGDALAHSALPGIAGAYLLSTYFGGPGKSSVLLLLGAAVAGIVGVLCVQLLSSETRLQEDSAIGIVLSVFFGIGIVLLSAIQALPATQAAGLSRFIYGQTAAMQLNDALVLTAAAGVVILLTTLLSKEFQLLCFDPDFASTLGWSTRLLDIVLLAILTVVTVIGLQSVGILLVISLLIVPATAARFWTERLRVMIILSALIGALSGYIGASASALLPRLPAGAVIVLTAGVFFFLSMAIAPRRGLLAGLFRRVLLGYRVTQDHVLRAIYEYHETRSKAYCTPLGLNELSAVLPQSPIMRAVFLRIASWRGLLRVRGQEVSLSEHGLEIAAQLVRNHRLWEEYLFSTAMIDTAHVDYSADFVEHVLSDDIVLAIEQRLEHAGRLPASTPQSLHSLVTEEDQS